MLITMKNRITYLETDPFEDYHPIFPNETLVNVMSFMSIKSLLKITKIDIYRDFANFDSLWEQVAYRNLELFCKYKPQHQSWRWFCLAIFSSHIYYHGGKIIFSYDTISPDVETMIRNFSTCNHGASFVCEDGVMFFDRNYIDSCIYNYPYMMKWYTNGNFYHGETKEGIRHGNGTMFYSGGVVYKGEWDLSMKNGYGVEISWRRNVSRKLEKRENGWIG